MIKWLLVVYSTMRINGSVGQLIDFDLESIFQSLAEIVALEYAERRLERREQGMNISSSGLTASQLGATVDQRTERGFFSDHYEQNGPGNGSDAAGWVGGQLVESEISTGSRFIVELPLRQNVDYHE
jgi:hypothetical protein